MKNLLNNSIISIFTVLLLTTLLPFSSFSQFSASDWDTVPFPYTTGGITGFVPDSSNNALFVTGQFINDGNNPPTENSYLLRYEQGTLIQFASFSYSPYDVAYYNGNLLVCGHFNSVNGIAVSGLAKFDGQTWSPFGNFKNSDGSTGFLRSISIIDDTLYVTGGFYIVDGDSINGVARWVNGKWEPLSESNKDFGGTGVPEVFKFKSEIYCGMDNCLYVLRDGDWVKIDGTPGPIIYDWEIYKDEIYACGRLNSNSGVVGNGILKWDGIQWSDVGSDLQNLNPNSDPSPFTMKEYDGKLYVAGGFYYAGNIPAQFVATWDGDRWCSMNTSEFHLYSTQIAGIGFLNDSIYCGFTGRIMELNDSSYYQGIVKCSLSITPDTCSIDFTTGVSQITEYPQEFFYPNPAHDEVFVDAPKATTNYRIYDMSGKTIKSGTVEASGRIALQGISGGMYILQVNENRSKLVIQ